MDKKNDVLLYLISLLMNREATHLPWSMTFLIKKAEMILGFPVSSN